MANVGIDGRKRLDFFRLGNLGLLLVRMPVFYPHEEPLILVIHGPVDGPVETLEPL